MVVSTVFTVVLLVIVSVVLSLVVLCFVLGGAEVSFIVLVPGVEDCEVVDSIVVDFGVVDFSVVVDSGVVDFSVVVVSVVVNFGVVDFSVVVDSAVVNFGVVDFSVVVDFFVVVKSCVVLGVSLLCAVLGVIAVPLVIVVCVEFTVAFSCAVGAETVPLAVELLVDAVELMLVAFGFCVEVSLITDRFVAEVVFRLGVAAVVLIGDVTLLVATVVFAELFVTFDAVGDCVALETEVSLEELTLTFTQTSDKLPAFAISQCLVRFNVVPLQARSWFVLFVEQTSVKFTLTVAF